MWLITQHQQRVLSNPFVVRLPMFRPFRITLDRFISRRRSKEIYETVFFPFFHIFPAFLQNRLGESDLLEQVFGLPVTKNISPLDYSQQFEAQSCLLDKVFYVEDSCCCRLDSRVEATARAFQEEWLSVGRFELTLPRISCTKCGGAFQCTHYPSAILW